MEKIVKIADLGISGEGSRGASYASVGADLELSYLSLSPNEDKIESKTLFFNFVEMFSFKAEPFMSSFREESYDCLCEVKNSKWIRKSDRRAAHYYPIRHYVVLISNFGYFEIAAAEYLFRNVDE